MADYGKQPCPRVLLQNQDLALAERVSAIAPTVVRVSNLYEINQAEFDLLVTDSCPSPLGRLSNPALAVDKHLSVSLPSFRVAQHGRVLRASPRRPLRRVLDPR